MSTPTTTAGGISDDLLDLGFSIIACAAAFWAGVELMRVAHQEALADLRRETDEAAGAARQYIWRVAEESGPGAALRDLLQDVPPEPADELEPEEKPVEMPQARIPRRRKSAD